MTAEVTSKILKWSLELKIPKEELIFKAIPEALWTVIAEGVSEGSLLLQTADLFMLCNETPENNFYKTYSHSSSAGYKNWLALEYFDTIKFSKTM